jgi:hypothetical protein
MLHSDGSIKRTVQLSDKEGKLASIQARTASCAFLNLAENAAVELERCERENICSKSLGPQQHWAFLYTF